MHLFLKREPSDKETMGKLYIDGNYFCHTMEPRYIYNGIKVCGQTAIAAGQYFIIMRPSPKFQRRLPMLMNVADFSFVLLHAGNRVTDTNGCILIGFQRGTDENGAVIWESRKAEDELVARMLAVENSQVIAITISDAI
jgi:hypothetical protein